VPQRSAFVLRIRPDRVDEYRAAHAAVWPEMLAALGEAGIRNYSIFLDGTRAFGYFESDDLAAAADFLARQPVSARWQDAMAGLLEERVPDGGPPALPEIFRLD
jgi:L-rhamnose mutarotase